MFDRLEAEAMQFLGGGLHLVDFVRGENVSRLLGPIGLAVEGVEIEVQRLELLLPAGPRHQLLAAHVRTCPSHVRRPSCRSRRVGFGSGRASSSCWASRS